MIIYKKTYPGELLQDIYYDMHEAFDSHFNSIIDKIPKDKHGFMKGKFTFTITHEPDSDNLIEVKPNGK